MVRIVRNATTPLQWRCSSVTRFPLPPHVLPLGWEQAINLTDMALYTAKSQGRNQSVGIVAADASAEPALKHIEADFERAWQEGRVTLKIAPGPRALAA